MNADIQLGYYVNAAWNKGLVTSALLLDVSQFYPSIHHNILLGTLQKQGFNAKLSNFLDNYFVGHKTQFAFNGWLTASSNFSVRVEQGCSLFQILSELSITLVLYKWVPVHLANPNNIGLQFYVDDGLIMTFTPRAMDESSAAQTQKNCLIIQNLFQDILSDLNHLGLEVEGDKLELIHFWKFWKPYSSIKPYGPDITIHTDEQKVTVKASNTMQYLRFFLDPKLSFQAHMQFYVNKVASTVNAIWMLDNSIWGFHPINKQRLYIAHIILLMLYDAQLWWDNS